MDTGHLRILELAESAKLLALHAFRIVGITLDLLLPASQACDGETFPRLARLSDAPMCRNLLAVDDGLAVGSVVVEVAPPFARHESLTQKTWQEVRASPDAGTDGFATEGWFDLRRIVCGRSGRPRSHRRRKIRRRVRLSRAGLGSRLPSPAPSRGRFGDSWFVSWVIWVGGEIGRLRCSS